MITQKNIEWYGRIPELLTADNTCDEMKIPSNLFFPRIYVAGKGRCLCCFANGSTRPHVASRVATVPSWVLLLVGLSGWNVRGVNFPVWSWRSSFASMLSIIGLFYLVRVSIHACKLSTHCRWGSGISLSSPVSIRTYSEHSQRSTQEPKRDPSRPEGTAHTPHTTDSRTYAAKRYTVTEYCAMRYATWHERCATWHERCATWHKLCYVTYEL